MADRLALGNGLGKWTAEGAMQSFAGLDPNRAPQLAEEEQPVYGETYGVGVPEDGASTNLYGDAAVDAEANATYGGNWQLGEQPTPPPKPPQPREDWVGAMAAVSLDVYAGAPAADSSTYAPTQGGTAPSLPPPREALAGRRAPPKPPAAEPEPGPPPPRPAGSKPTPVAGRPQAALPPGTARRRAQAPLPASRGGAGATHQPGDLLYYGQGVQSAPAPGPDGDDGVYATADYEAAATSTDDGVYSVAEDAAGGGGGGGATVPFDPQYGYAEEYSRTNQTAAHAGPMAAPYVPPQYGYVSTHDAQAGFRPPLHQPGFAAAGPMAGQPPFGGFVSGVFPGGQPARPPQQHFVGGPAFGGQPAAPRLDPLEAELRQYRWYAHNIVRADAEAMLSRENVGSFIVRPGRVRDRRVLSIRLSQGYSHLEITQDPQTREYILGAFSLPHASVPALIAHHRDVPIEILHREDIYLVDPSPATQALYGGGIPATYESIPH